jgi:hypothetical protein
MKEEFSKEIQIMENNQVEILQMKNLKKNQIKNTVMVLSPEKLKHKEEYQRWRGRLSRYCT